MKTIVRKVFSVVFFSFLSLSLLADGAEGELEDGKFKLNGVSGINMSQTAMSNWAAGGDNSFAGTIYLNGSLKRKSGYWLWDSDLALEYGLTNTKSNGTRKAGDKLEFSTKLGYSTDNKWFYTAKADFKTQFAKGYNYDGKEKGQYISKFMAPAYSTISLGIDYKPKDWYSVYMSPVAGKLTFVRDDYLSSIGAFGVDENKKFRAELGAFVEGKLERDIMENVKVISKISLFTAYDKSFGNVDVDWDILFSMKINKFLSATLNTTLKYDDDIKTVKVNEDGTSVERGPKIQLKEVLGVGLAYNF